MEEIAEYRYFIVYRSSTKDGRFEIRRESKITSIKDIEDIEKTLSDEYGEKVLICDWKLFESEAQ